MLGKHFCKKIYHFTAACIEHNRIDTTEKNLQVSIRTDNFPKTVHHLECIFLKVEVK